MLTPRQPVILSLSLSLSLLLSPPGARKEGERNHSCKLSLLIYILMSHRIYALRDDDDARNSFVKKNVDHSDEKRAKIWLHTPQLFRSACKDVRSKKGKSIFDE